jgi:hypothetical protein
MRLGATKRTVAIFAAIILLFIVVLFLGRSLSAQSGGQYDLSWSTISGGGETSSMGGQYVLGATIGQTGAGGMAGGNYQLEGGFWHCFLLAFPGCSIEGPQPSLYLPIITVSDS